MACVAVLDADPVAPFGGPYDCHGHIRRMLPGPWMTDGGACCGRYWGRLIAAFERSMVFQGLEPLLMALQLVLSYELCVPVGGFPHRLVTLAFQALLFLGQLQDARILFKP